MPNGNTPGLIVGGGEEWNATILMNEELRRRRHRIGGMCSGVHCKVGRLNLWIGSLIGQWTDWVGMRLDK